MYFPTYGRICIYVKTLAYKRVLNQWIPQRQKQWFHPLI